MIVHSPTSRSPRLGLGALGQLGADPLLHGLGARLDDAYHCLRRVAPAGMPAIETVVVGPGGTFAMSRFGERGGYRRRNGHWYRWNRSTESWAPWVATPIDEVRLAARRLSLYLERAGLPPTVEPCLVTAPGAVFGWEPPDTPGATIFGMEEIDGLSARLARDERLSAAQVDRIVALLDPRQPLPRLAPSTPG